jgi:hypothetical protein
MAALNPGLCGSAVLTPTSNSTYPLQIPHDGWLLASHSAHSPLHTWPCWTHGLLTKAIPQPPLQQYVAIWLSSSHWKKRIYHFQVSPLKRWAVCALMLFLGEGKLTFLLSLIKWKPHVKDTRTGPAPLQTGTQEEINFHLISTIVDLWRLWVTLIEKHAQEAWMRQIVHLPRLLSIKYFKWGVHIYVRKCSIQFYLMEYL